MTNEETTNRRSERRPGAAAAAAAAARACPRLPDGWIEPVRASPCGRGGCAALVRRSAAEANTRSVRSRARPARHRERVRGHMEASGGRASSLRTRSGPWRQRSREMRLIRNDLPRAPHCAREMRTLRAVTPPRRPRCACGALASAPELLLGPLERCIWSCACAVASGATQHASTPAEVCDRPQRRRRVRHKSHATGVDAAWYVLEECRGQLGYEAPASGVRCQSVRAKTDHR